jgi:hypothetical protein
VKRVSKPFYITSLLGGWLAGKAAFIFRWLQEPPYAGVVQGERFVGSPLAWALLGVAATTTLYATVVHLILVYKMWRAVPRPFARTTPARAVLLLLVPLFNVYWIFQAYWGWTRDFNGYARSRGLRVAAMPEEAALAMCLIPLVAFPLLAAVYLAGMPLLYALLSELCEVLMLGLLVVVLWRACDGINAAARADAAAAAEPTGPWAGTAPAALPAGHASSLLGVASVVLGVGGFFTLGLTGWLGLAFGIRLLSEIRKGRRSRRDRGLAKAGIAISAGTILALTPILVILLVQLYQRLQ